MKRDPPAAQHPSSVWCAQLCLIPLPLIDLLSRKQREQKPQNTLPLLATCCLQLATLVAGGGGEGWGGALGPLKGKGTIRGRLREEVPPNDPEHFENSLSGVPGKSQTSGWETRRRAECVWAAQERRCSDVIRVSSFSFDWTLFRTGGKGGGVGNMANKLLLKSLPSFSLNYTCFYVFV